MLLRIQKSRNAYLGDVERQSKDEFNLGYTENEIVEQDTQVELRCPLEGKINLFKYIFEGSGKFS